MPSPAARRLEYKTGGACAVRYPGDLTIAAGTAPSPRRLPKSQPARLDFPDPSGNFWGGQGGAPTPRTRPPRRDWSTPTPFPRAVCREGGCGRCPPRRTPPFGSHAPELPGGARACVGGRAACGGLLPGPDAPPWGCRGGSGAMMSSVDVCGCWYYMTCACLRASFVTV